MLLFWALVLPALALAVLSFQGERGRARFYRTAREETPDAPLPAATVIVPVKGFDEGLRENLEALTALDYPDYELLVVAREPGDIPEGALPAGARAVFAGHGDDKTGEKVQNLLAGVAAARPESEIYAFADSDGRAGKGWLKALAAALAADRAGAATGYRWYLPDPPDFWSLARSVWNAVIAGRLGPGPNDFAWGGAMAIRREVFFRCRVPEFWESSVSDDYSLSAAVRRAGLEIHYTPGALVASTDHVSRGELLHWIRRQMVITRVYYPRLWWMGLIAHLIYCAATVACAAVLVQGHLAGALALALLLGLGMGKGASRAAMIRGVLPEYDGWFRRHGWIHTLGTPLATWLWMYSLLASALTSTIEWRGNRYRLSKRGTRRL